MQAPRGMKRQEIDILVYVQLTNSVNRRGSLAENSFTITQEIETLETFVQLLSKRGTHLSRFHTNQLHMLRLFPRKRIRVSNCIKRWAEEPVILQQRVQL